jgi:hypothetical protein
MSLEQIQRRTIETTFTQLFEAPINGKSISQIRIPLIQRDYAQGRDGETVTRIRDRFLDVLTRALSDGASSVDLDFVYGDVTQKGVLLPLDGQQRLTTLFLLHWYVAQRADIDLSQAKWTQFSYETRPSARQFCEFLVNTNIEWDGVENNLSGWLEDQPGYFLTWKHDPTIKSMLVMLNAIHKKLDSSITDYMSVWQRLVSTSVPAIRFHLLPMEENGLTDSLYIKMNSRGKPLTPFENFKADFEGMLKRKHAQHADSFARRIDNDWANLFWEYRGENHLIDEEFMRYFRFVTEIYAWKNGQFSPDVAIEDLAIDVYGGDSSAPIIYLFESLDAWLTPHSGGSQNGYVKQIFNDLFTLEPDVSPNDRLMLFSHPGSEKTIDLFDCCCRLYGGGPKLWTYGNTLLFYAVLVSQIANRFEDAALRPEEIRRRLRIVRNLIEASSDELALRESNAKNRMQNLITDVETIMLTGDVINLSSLSFNQAQVSDEARKSQFISQHPELALALYTLEDHPLLRGGLTAFPLDPQLFDIRASAFKGVFEEAIWPSLTKALLTKGDYGRHWERGEGAYVSLGSYKNSQPWRELFRGRRNETYHPMTKSLVALLDDVSRRQGTPAASLEDICSEFLANPQTPKDWIYYFVKYPEMGSAPQGGYVFEKSRFRACRLEGKYVYSFQDPYLLALVSKAGLSDKPGCFKENWNWFYGLQDESGPRPLTLSSLGVSIECVEAGWQINVPQEFPIELLPALNQTLQNHGISLTDHLLRTVSEDDLTADSVDRIEKGAELLKSLVEIDSSKLSNSIPAALAQERKFAESES